MLIPKLSDLPVYPGGQLQVYVLEPSTHVAPLRHLWPRQSSDRVLHLTLTSSQPTNARSRRDR